MIASLRETKTRLSEMIALAANGEDILITVRGKPKARLTRIESPSDIDAETWKSELLRLHQTSDSGSRSVSSLDIIDDIRGDRT